MWQRCSFFIHWNLETNLRTQLTCRVSLSLSRWALLDVHFMREFMSSSKSVCVAPWKIPWSSCAISPYSHGNFSSTEGRPTFQQQTQQNSCHVPYAYLQYIHDTSQNSFSCYMYTEWVTVIALPMSSSNITSKFIYTDQLLMNSKVHLE